MMDVQRWTIRRRLLLAFLGVLIPYLALAGVGAVGFRALWQRVKAIQEEVVMEMKGAADLQVAVIQLVMPANDYLITGNPGEREEFEERLAQVREILARLEAAHARHPEELKLLGRVKGQLPRLEALSREILAVPDPRADRAAPAKMKTLDDLGDSVAADLARFRQISEREIGEEIERGLLLVRRIAALGLAAVIVSVLGGIALGLVFSRWITRPIQAIAGVSRRMAGGDLSQRVDVGAGGELGETAQAFNAMADDLEASQTTLRWKNEESEARRREAEALAEVGRDLAKSLDLDVVSQRVADSICQLLRLRFSAVYRLEPESGDLVAVAVSGNMGPAFARNLVFPRGTGAVGLAVRERCPVISQDVLADPRLTITPEVRARIEQAQFRAVLALPLLAEGRTIGALGIGDQAGRVFDADEIRLAEAFAAQAALALHNARLVEDLKIRQARLETLLDVNRRLSAIQTLDSLLGKITEACGRLLHSDSVGICLVEGEELVVRATWGDAREALSTSRIRIGQSLTGIVAATGEPRIVPNLAEDTRMTPEHREATLRLGLRAWLGVPVKVGERVAGVLSIWTRREGGFSDEDLAIATAFASQAAIALENARLFQEAQDALADLKTAQEQLVRGATMRALGELASGAAHHLNNLLAIMLGRIRLLLSSKEAALVRRPLEIVERAAVDASEVVRRLSRFARTQATEERQALDLKQLATEVLEMTRARWQDSAQVQGIRIEVALEGEDVPPVMGNAAALREVLINLVLNAVDALPTGGRIVLRMFRDGGWVCLAVTDTGGGMSREVRERVLEPFFTTKGPKSTGLGLSVSYGILQRHGGELTVESTEGQGTTVTVRLPAHSAPQGERARAGAESTPAGASHLRILVIDDDEEVREMLAEMLASLGYKVFQAAEGRQGLALLEAGEAIDLVLTDLGMPEMTGWQVARTIKARWPGLPVAVLTGWGDQVDEAAADRHLVAGVLSKPVTPEGLREFIAACRGTP